MHHMHLPTQLEELSLVAAPGLGANSVIDWMFLVSEHCSTCKVVAAEQ